VSAHLAARAAWRYRDFIVTSFKREFAMRYLGTQFGVFWAIAQPLTLILIYSIVFSELMRPALPGHPSKFAYSVYLTAGIISWQLFSELLGRCVGMFVNNAQLLKKVSIPKITMPIIASLYALSTFAITFMLFLGFAGLAGYWPGWHLLAVVPVILLMTVFAMGLGILLATINVFYRDVEQSVNVVLQVWFWLTPVVYPATTLPKYIASVLEWNPMWPMIRAMQNIFLDHRSPDWSTLIYPAALAILIILVAGYAFERLSDDLVDEL